MVSRESSRYLSATIGPALLVLNVDKAIMQKEEQLEKRRNPLAFITIGEWYKG